MAVSLEQIESFHQFAHDRAKNGGADLTMDEIYDLWRLENLPPEELQESLESLRRGIADAEAGRVRPADDVIEELRHRIEAASE
jgi:hypothetical protein